MIQGRLIGIDHGLKRIGLAVSDAMGLVARELTVIKRGGQQADFEQIKRIAARHHAVGFVVGLPLNPGAEANADSQANRVRRWAAEFEASTTLPVILWDEQLSSVDARELARMKRRRPRDPIDDLAARVILQTYLDALRDGLAEPPA